MFNELIQDQIWLPQLCHALSQSVPPGPHDPTLTHLAGTTCSNNAITTSNLSIHGLWPNYENGKNT